MNRKEHLEWAKKRALEYSAKNDLTGAIGSFANDLKKHIELENHPALGLMMTLLFTGSLSTKAAVEDFINGFN